LREDDPSRRDLDAPRDRGNSSQPGQFRESRVPAALAAAGLAEKTLCFQSFVLEFSMSISFYTSEIDIYYME
jgi:hypothetical protein